VIPVAEGRNLAVLTEAAVRSTILRLRGIDSMQVFFERQRALMDEEQALESAKPSSNDPKD